MNDSLRWLRLYLGVSGVIAFLNVGAVAQAKAMENPPAWALPLSLAFATVSVFAGCLALLASWLAPRLAITAPGFIRAAILLYGAIALVAHAPVLEQDRFLHVSLILFWTGTTVHFYRMTGRIAAGSKETGASEKS